MDIIVNPAAAGGRAGREWPRVENLIKSLGNDVRPIFTEAPWHAVELAAEAVAAGVKTVVAAGGDGTACEVAEGLYRAGGGTLAMLPLGTGNDIGNAFGIPTDLEAAIRVAAAGDTRKADLIKVGDHVVVNAIGLGLLADISRRAARIKVVRGIAAYLVTALASLFAYRSPQVRVETPDQSYEGLITLIAIQSGPTTGGGFMLTPSAIPDDGLLDATILEGMGPMRRLQGLHAAMRGTLGNMAGASELRAPYLEVHHEVPIPIHLDGNVEMLEPPLTRFEILANALEIAAPPKYPVP
jgi:YegS/Rv2252/BmrU family lipid kinase